MSEAIERPGPEAPPSIAVSMPARNAERWIGAAIESVLAQEDVDASLVVVDDASDDRTVAVASGFAGDRVTVLRNARRAGIGACHNRVLAESDAPLIAHVDADDVIAPGALAKLARAVTRGEGVGQAYCDFYPLDAAGHTDPAMRAAWAALFAATRTGPIDYPRALVIHGMVVGALRTYRRAVFDAVGPFDEALPWAVDYEMALRVAERFDFARVPEMLYGRRLHADGVSQGVTAKPLRQWWMRWTLVRRRLRAGRGTLFGHGRSTTHARLLRGLAPALRATLRGGAAGP